MKILYYQTETIFNTEQLNITIVFIILLQWLEGIKFALFSRQDYDRAIKRCSTENVWIENVSSNSNKIKSLVENAIFTVQWIGYWYSLFIVWNID